MNTELLRSPVSGHSIELTSDGDLLAGQQKVGKYFSDEQRIEWIAFNDYPGLDNRILKEIQKYDAWASEEACKLPIVSLEKRPFSIDEEKAYLKSVNLKSLGLSMDMLFRSKSVLDIGGSCKDSWRFLRSGADAIHQVEVSSPSQRLGLKRITKMLPDSDQKLIDRVFFHTSPAEFLPFADQSFDFVFSRSTIHHTDRSRIIPEIHRVLRPGGQLLFIEPLRSRIVYRIVHFMRWIARRDRGTDDPLTINDIRLLRDFFSQVSFRPNNPLEYDIKDAFCWLGFKGIRPDNPVIYAVK